MKRMVGFGMNGRFILGILVLLTLVGFASADSYQLYCVPAGQVVDLGALCNPAMDPRSGPITLCMHLLDNGKICPANLNVCNGLGITCASNASTTIDTIPPVLTINSPSNNGVYTDRAVLLNFAVDETSDVYFMDELNTPGTWVRVCKECRSHSRKRNFKDGTNQLLFRTTDRSGNDAYNNLTFFIDTKAPQIKSVLPKDGFTSGLFSVEFLESNPKNLTIRYGNTVSGMRSHRVNLTTCTDGLAGRKICEFQANMADYDNEQIELWAEMTDVANNFVASKHNQLKVDFSDPVIVELEHEVDGKNVNFRIELDEANPDKISYRDNSERNPKWRTLCSRMKTEVCEKKISFKDGEHEVDFEITDLAGNSIETSVNFFTDSKKPKIKKTLPKAGFTSGEFEVEFDEANPESLVLHYGNFLTGMRNSSLNFEEDCFVDRTYKCSKHVNVDDYDGEEIAFYFILEDIVGQSVESRHTEVDVDNTYPVIESITHEIDRNRATIEIEITEQNLDEVRYVNNAEPRPSDRSFCTKLVNGMCKRTITLRPGANELSFQVIDDAGNSVGQGYEIVL